MKKNSGFYSELKSLRKRLPKSFVAGFLVAAVVLGVLIIGSANTTCNFAGCPEPTECGRTVNGFIQIACAQRLSGISRTGNFRLIRDINLNDPSAPSNQRFSNWSPIHPGITSTTAYGGTFDGGNHTISELRIDRLGPTAGTGLFGGLFGATVRDLTIRLSAEGITGGGERKAGLAGNAYGRTEIDNVHVIGVANAPQDDGTASGGSPIQGAANYIAGLVGVVNNSSVKNSSTANINLNGYSYVAGFVGVVYNSGAIDNSRVENIDMNGFSYVAGFVGAVYNGGTVNNSHVVNIRVGSTNATTAHPGAYTAGFAGAIYHDYRAGTAHVTNSSVDGAVVHARGSYPGGFVGALYGVIDALRPHELADISSVDNIRVNNARVSAGGAYAGGFVGSIYDRARANDVIVTNSHVSTGLYYAGGFAGEITGSSAVSNSFVDNTVVNANSSPTVYGAGGFAGIIYTYARVTGCGVSQSAVTGGATVTIYGSAGGFAAAIHGSARISTSFVENTDVTGTRVVGGFVGDFAVSARLENTYVNGWTRPDINTLSEDAIKALARTGDYIHGPGPRYGVVVPVGTVGAVGPVGRAARVTGDREVGGFYGNSTSGTNDSIFNSYAAIEANRGNPFGSGGTVSYLGTNYFDQQMMSGTSGTGSRPQGRNTIPMSLRIPADNGNTYVGWSWHWYGDDAPPTIANLSWGGPWHIDGNDPVVDFEYRSYPYFEFGRGGELIIIPGDIDADWDRLEYAISLFEVEYEDEEGNTHTYYPPAVITIYPFGTTEITENLEEGILVIQDDIERINVEDDYIINSTGYAIGVKRSVKLISSDEDYDVLLYTLEETDGRHFFIFGEVNVTFEFENVIVDGAEVAGGIDVLYDDEFPGTATIQNAVIQNCNAHEGAGIWVSDYSGLVITGSDTMIRNNESDGNGGGVFVAGRLNFVAGTISDNKAEFGGGVFVATGAEATMTSADAVIRGNSAVDGGGVWNLGSFTLSNGQISGNTAQFSGSGVLNLDLFIMENGRITENGRDYYSVTGGGVYNTGTFAMRDGTIAGNTAAEGGGVSNAGTFAIDGGEIRDNNAEIAGGNLWNSGVFHSVGVTIADVFELIPDR